MFFKIMIPLSILLVALVMAGREGATYNSCVCWEDYKAEYNENGAHCKATNQFHIMPCNMVKAPNCQCSGKGSSILKDRTGTWCTKYRKGEELMRWPCENTKEWDDFFKENPDFI
ncbi:uncharacterized protein LOC109599281 [Aethina tumida]|uniref:uncharacterized protein LOC109599281 n=1 Tax=Aethina tumida TaxID=116153 RepID=UPI00096B4042|nr:uncharacterized protein LOC109599281 [Aethina tumida]